jgi:hypothetical protein
MCAASNIIDAEDGKGRRRDRQNGTDFADDGKGTVKNGGQLRGGSVLSETAFDEPTQN